MKPAGLTTKIVASSGSGSVYRPSAPVTATSRPLETSTPASPGLAALAMPEPSRSSNTWPETCVACDSCAAAPPRLDRGEGEPARRADQHVAPRDSTAMMFRHSATSNSRAGRKGPGHDAVMKRGPLRLEARSMVTEPTPGCRRRQPTLRWGSAEAVQGRRLSERACPRGSAAWIGGRAENPAAHIHQRARSDRSRAWKRPSVVALGFSVASRLSFNAARQFWTAGSGGLEQAELGQRGDAVVEADLLRDLAVDHLQHRCAGEAHACGRSRREGRRPGSL